jgi:hypothetical protein
MNRNLAITHHLRNLSIRALQAGAETISSG